ncbi:U-box domain-containing protein [Parachlamydia acanthamoebae]|uniref:U-box domain-containing protein n=1 Tax=Parachlamydia acanthamoebae TaxID=83552 RepID=UPI000750C1C8|nr:U-box domain-containing protein [Parachlamydia acanthamoebae]
MEAPSSSYATTSNFSVNPSLIESVIIEPPQDDSHLVELEIWGKGCIKKEMRCDELSSILNIIPHEKIKFLRESSICRTCFCWDFTLVSNDHPARQISTIFSRERDSRNCSETFKECLALIKSKLSQLECVPKCFIVIPSIVNDRFEEMYRYFEEAGIDMIKKEPNQREFLFNYENVSKHDVFCRIEIEEKGEWTNEFLFQFLKIENKRIVTFAFFEPKKAPHKDNCDNWSVNLFNSLEPKQFYLNILKGICVAVGLHILPGHFMMDLEKKWEERIGKLIERIEKPPIVRILSKKWPNVSTLNLSALDRPREFVEGEVQAISSHSDEAENEMARSWMCERKTPRADPLPHSVAFEQMLVYLNSQKNDRSDIFVNVVDPRGGDFDLDSEAYGIVGELRMAGCLHNTQKEKPSTATIVVYTKTYHEKRAHLKEIRCHQDLLDDAKKTTVFLLQKCIVLPSEIKELKDRGARILDLSDAGSPRLYWDKLKLFAKIMGVHKTKVNLDSGEQSFMRHLKSEYKRFIGSDRLPTPAQKAYKECLSLIKDEVFEYQKKCFVLDSCGETVDVEASALHKDLKSAGILPLRHKANPQLCLQTSKLLTLAITTEADAIIVVLSKLYFEAREINRELRIAEDIISSEFQKNLEKVTVFKKEKLEEPIPIFKGYYSIIEKTKKDPQLYWEKLERIVHIAGISQKEITRNGVCIKFIDFLKKEWERKLNPSIPQKEIYVSHEVENEACIAPTFKQEDMTCPITHDYMTDPVTASDGCTYEREAIEKWYKLDGSSPITRKKLTGVFVPHESLRASIKDHLSQSYSE